MKVSFIAMMTVAGQDLDADGVGDTQLPYTNGGLMALPGDPHPLVGDPDIEELDNPQTLCDRFWIDLGRNTRQSGQEFDTANGTHFATDGTDLYLLEGSNSVRLSRFDAGSGLYLPRASVPEAVWDGGDLQHGGGLYYATTGVQFNPANGSGKGPRLYAYDALADSWSPRPSSTVGATVVANEALAYDPRGGLLYATIVDVATGGNPLLRQCLAIFDESAGAWTGATAPSGVSWSAASEAECLDGRVYVWRGGFAGGAVNGSDSYLHVYDIGGGTWSQTPALQDSGVIPGFRSGALDVWGVALTADPRRGLLMLIGGEANKQVYVHDAAAGTWAVAPHAVYDGGWGDGLEYVAASETLYQIDGRNSLGAPQGTAAMARESSDVDEDGAVGVQDLVLVIVAWGPCTAPCPADTNGDGAVDVMDLVAVLLDWGAVGCK